MNAEEMFKKMGYYQKENDNYCIRYEGINDVSFMFWLQKKCFFATIKTEEYGVGSYGIEPKALKAVIQQFKELGWLEEEKQKTKEETNFEHFFEYLSTKRMSDFALIDGRITQCSVTRCSKCDFNNDCIEGKFTWLKQAYEKPKYKVTQFEYDLLNAYKNSGMRQCISNYGTLLEMYGKGHFKGIDTSTPIHEILDNCEVEG